MEGRSRRFLFLVLLTALAALPAAAQIRVDSILPRLNAVPTAIAPITPQALLPNISVPTLNAVPTLAPSLAMPLLPSVSPAVPIAVPPAAAPSLAHIAAASESPRRDGASPSSVLNAFWDGQAPREAAPLDGPARPAAAAPEEPSRAINSFWSGFDDYEGESSLQTLGAADESDAGSAAPWLVLKDRTLAAALDSAVTLARTTDAGRRALDAAEKALAAEGRTLSIDVKDLGRNWGEYDYLDGRMRLHRRLFEKGREAELAGTLAHELLHVAQHAAGLPSNALELEIEAHLQDLALMNELGLRTPPHTFARQTEEALKKGPAAFIALIQMAVPGSPFLGESTFADIVDQLEQDLDSAEGRRGPRAGKYADAIARDLKSLRSKKGRAAYKAFSQRVLALLKSRAAEAGR